MTEVVIPSGTNFADALRGLVLQRLPDADFSIASPAASYTIPMQMIYAEARDPWADAEDLACAIGMRLKRRGNHVKVYVPLGQRIQHARWKFIEQPIRRMKRGIADVLFPPVEYPDPDYSD
jgi:hypothetical protein